MLSETKKKYLKSQHKKGLNLYEQIYSNDYSKTRY